MSSEQLPPLRVRESDSDPNVIPTYEIILSDNLVGVRRSATSIAISANTGAGAAGAVYAATGNQYIVLAAAADLTAERVFTASTGLQITDAGAGGAYSVGMIVPVSVTSGGTGASNAFPTGSLIVSSAGGTYTHQNASLAFDIATRTFLIGGTTAAVASVSIDSAGATVFNEQGNAVDFRVESDTNTAGLIILASDGRALHGLGTGGARGGLGGVLDANGVSVANIGTADIALISYTMPANSFNRTGQVIHYFYRGIGANNADSKTVNIRFGSQLMVAELLTANADTHWWGDAWIIRTGANTQRFQANFHQENLSGGAITDAQDSGASTVTDTSDIDIRVTATSTANSNVTQTFGIVLFYD